MTSWSSNTFVVPLCLLKALKKHSFCSISQLTKNICTDLLNSTPHASLLTVFFSTSSMLNFSQLPVSAAYF